MELSTPCRQHVEETLKSSPGSTMSHLWFGQVTHSHVFWCPLSTVSVFPNPGFFVNSEWKCLTLNSTNASDNRCYNSTWESVLSNWQPQEPVEWKKPFLHRLPTWLMQRPWTLTSVFLPDVTLTPAPPSHSSKIWIFLSSTDHPDYLCEQPVTSRFGQKRVWQCTPTPPHSILRYNTGTHAGTHIPFYPHAFC